MPLPRCSLAEAKQWNPEKIQRGSHILEQSLHDLLQVHRHWSQRFPGERAVLQEIHHYSVQPPGRSLKPEKIIVSGLVEAFGVVFHDGF